MKNFLITGLVLAVTLVFAACGEKEKGGTIEVVNDSDALTANFSISKFNILKPTEVLTPLATKEGIAPGAKATFSVDEDGTYSITGTFYSPLAPALTSPGELGKTTNVSGGGTQTVRMKAVVE